MALCGLCKRETETFAGTLIFLLDFKWITYWYYQNFTFYIVGLFNPIQLLFIKNKFTLHEGSNIRYLQVFQKEYILIAKNDANEQERNTQAHTHTHIYTNTETKMRLTRTCCYQWLKVRFSHLVKHDPSLSRYYFTALLFCPFLWKIWPSYFGI